MRYFFIVNPSAGKGNKAEKLMQDIRSVCDAREVDYVLYTTTEVGDAERYVRETCEKSKERGESIRVFACGGDGTINECVNGAAGFDHVQIGVFPIGTGNDFVRNFGGAKVFFDVETQLDGNPISLDLIKYNSRYCVNMINIGFDCEVAARTATLKTNPLVPGKFAYICGLLAEFVKKSGTEFANCVIDGADQGSKRLLLSLFANGGFCGGGFYSAPLADLSDGLIDFCFVRDIPRLTFLKLVGPYKSGTHLELKNRDEIFEYGKCREIKLTFSETVKICVDGEIDTCDHLTLTIEKGAIQFVVPHGVSTNRTASPEAELVK